MALSCLFFALGRARGLDLEKQGKGWTGADSPGCVLRQIMGDGFIGDDRITPVIKCDSLWKELGAEPVGLTCNRVNA
jgi:hypothetical protein